MAEYDDDDEHSSECKLLIANEVRQACTQPRAPSLFSLGVGRGTLQLFHYWDYAKLNIFVGGGSISEAHHQKRNLALDANHMDVYHSKGAFTLSVRDSSVESPNTMLVI